MPKINENSQKSATEKPNSSVRKWAKTTDQKKNKKKKIEEDIQMAVKHLKRY